MSGWIGQSIGFARRHRLALDGLAVLGLSILGFAAVHRFLAEVHLRDAIAAWHLIGVKQIGAAVVLTATSYALLTLYDVLALRAIGRSLPYRTAALASFTSYALSHNLGLALLTGGAARYRIYSAAGLDVPDIARVMATASAGFWAGVTVTTATALVANSHIFRMGSFDLAPPVLRVTGITILLLAGLALLALRGRRTLRIFSWGLPCPSPGQAFALVLVAALDLAAAAAALLVLVPGANIQDFPLLFLGYALAVVVGLLSHVPGGLGVFEAVILAALSASPRPALLAGLVMYRLVYYLLPLGLAAILLAAHERRRIRRRIAVAAGAARPALHALAPPILAALVFIGGVVLLVSGSLPGIPHRLQLLHHVVPLPFVEASHIAASLAGTGLILVASGLYRRLDAAFLLCRALLVAGSVFSLAKGFDVEEASILLIIVGLLQVSRRAFYRRTALTTALDSPRSIVAAAIAIGFSTSVGLFAYKHVAYQNDLWWQFAWHGDASRFLRASFATAVALIGFGINRLLGYGRPVDGVEAGIPTTPAAALALSSRTDAMLALTGDKLFLRSPSGNAFLMYQVQGQTWIVMGDPVGAREEWADLLWRIRAQADAAQGRLLLYQISVDALPAAIELGLHLVKYGEEARVDLVRFGLEGHEMRSLRQAERRVARAGVSFEIVPAACVPALIPELREISDSWLRIKGHSEKGFSVGRFDPVYLSQFDCALVRQNARIVAFANIWTTADHSELSVDLMRHRHDMSRGTMDFLFVQLMRFGQRSGYRWFNLGLAALSGIEARRLAPVWAQAGAWLYRHGETLYGFEGLRAYKEKFGPVWEPRYIAGPGGTALVGSLFDLQNLVRGSLRDSAKNGRTIEYRSLWFGSNSRNLGDLITGLRTKRVRTRKNRGFSLKPYQESAK
jgi:phosphatidylglycerol lysyltransferase